MGLLIGDHLTPTANDMPYWDGAKWVLEPHRAVLDAHTRNPFEVMPVGAYLGAPFAYTNVSGALNLNTLYATLINVPRAMTFDRIVLEVVVLAAGMSAYLGIYNAHATTLYPTSLVVDGGTVSLNVATVVTAIINQALAKGLYYVVVLPEANFTTQLLRYTIGPLGLKTSDLQDSLGGWTVAQAYGALPAAFPGAGAANMVPANLALRTLSMD